MKFCPVKKITSLQIDSLVTVPPKNTQPTHTNTMLSRAMSGMICAEEALTCCEMKEDEIKMVWMEMRTETGQNTAAFGLKCTSAQRLPLQQEYM